MPNFNKSARISFRADASLVIGAGHIARCLSLAEALREDGAECEFICRALPGHMRDAIVEAGFFCTLLPCNVWSTQGAQQIGGWTDVPWAQDALETRAVLEERPAEWVILDHYGFDVEWEDAAVPAGTRRLVIDDLANRPHHADILLDANLGRLPQDYETLLNKSCDLLIGPRFALLRPSFALRRPHALAQRSGRQPFHALISFGGVDLPDATSQVLQVLSDTNVTDRFQATVVLGKHAPALEKVSKLINEVSFPCRLIVDTPNMTELMETADFSIGAGGTTSWERCCLGLPALIITIAENQVGASEAVDHAVAGIYLGNLAQGRWQLELKRAMADLLRGGSLSRMAEAAAAICDGDGSLRVAAEILPCKLSKRAATIGDARRIWEWRRAGGAEKFRKSVRDETYSSHILWLDEKLADPNCNLIIIMKNRLPMGYVRLDRSNDCRAVISICLAQEQRGKRYGAAVLDIAHDFARTIGYTTVLAEIHSANLASLRLFANVGYTEVGRTGEFGTYSFNMGVSST